MNLRSRILGLAGKKPSKDNSADLKILIAGSSTPTKPGGCGWLVRCAALPIFTLKRRQPERPLGTFKIGSVRSLSDMYQEP